MKQIKHINCISYNALNARQKENYNFHKVAALLADYGFTSMKLTDDWEYADFVAVHVDGDTMLKVQLKGRWGIYQRYQHKNIYLAFPATHNNVRKWHLIHHEEIMEMVERIAPHYLQTQSWQEKGEYYSMEPNQMLREAFKPYIIDSQLVPELPLRNI